MCTVGGRERKRFTELAGNVKWDHAAFTGRRLARLGVGADWYVP
jgi:hypothetical protein